MAVTVTFALPFFSADIAASRDALTGYLGRGLFTDAVLRPMGDMDVTVDADAWRSLFGYAPTDVRYVADVARHALGWS